jgi:hypothetical protein
MHWKMVSIITSSRCSLHIQVCFTTDIIPELAFYVLLCIRTILFSNGGASVISAFLESHFNREYETGNVVCMIIC